MSDEALRLATPRTLARWEQEWKLAETSGGRSSPAHGMCDFAEELERELTALRSEVEKLRVELDTEQAALRESRARAAQRKVELTAASALAAQRGEDTKRLEFLEREWFMQDEHRVWSSAWNETWDAGAHDTLRDAIDAAMKESAK